MAAVAPSGIGMFIWLPQQCEGGNWDAITAKALDCGLSWIIFHNFWSKTAAMQLKQAGIYVAYSFYSKPGPTIPHQIDGAKAAFDSGYCDAVLFDAETAWEVLDDGKPGWRGPEATDFVNQLRAAVGDSCYLANAGCWQRPNFHQGYPDKEFAAIADCAMPEVYWSEFPPGESYSAIITESEREWSTNTSVLAYKSVIRLGSSYGTNGPVPGGKRPLELADFTDFVQRYKVCAFWSWLHCPQWAWDHLKSLKPIDVTDGGKNNPVYVNPDYPTGGQDPI